MAAGPGRRRTPGLRREEVADIAGISVDWYIRLEQGRPVTPSRPTVDALARALRLTDTERQHLHALAGDGPHGPLRRESVPPALTRLLKKLTQPAYVMDRRRDLIAFNDAAADTFDFDRLEGGGERNVLILMLTDPWIRELFGAGWAGVAQRMLSRFRATYDLWAGDPMLTVLVQQMRDGCPEFGEWWAHHEVHGSASSHKILHHPDRGSITVEPSSFEPVDSPGLKLVIYNQI